MPTRRLHSLLVSIALAALILASAVDQALAAAPEPEFPYIAYVVDSDALVRSGPGRKHYATAQLPVGYAVEVFRHDSNGWCAIRPPEGSFGLVALRELQPLDGRTAQVTADGVAARVGSALGDQHSAVQVLLQRGETLGLLEQPSPTNPWVRIAPPAGEFRWIAAQRLSRIPPTETVAEPAAATPAASFAGVGWQNPALAANAVGASVGARPIITPEPADDALPGAGDPFAHLRRPAPELAPAIASTANPTGSAWASEALAVDPRTAGVVTAVDVSDDIEIIPGSPAAIQQAQFEQAAGAATTLAGDAASATPGGPPRIRFEGLTPRRQLGPLDPRVAEMQIHLSQIVIGAPASWQFGSLRDEATALLAQEQTTACREQLRDLLDRIATFETVQSRYRILPPNLQVFAAAGATPAPGAPAQGSDVGSELIARIRSDLGRGDSAAGAVDNGITPTPGGPDAAAVEALYDAVGTLKPVVSRREHAPQFALVDDQGEVVTFVTAAPDVNLRAYVGQRIGVRGSRGFMPEFRRAHVVASRVTNLDGAIVK